MMPPHRRPLWVSRFLSYAGNLHQQNRVSWHHSFNNKVDPVQLVCFDLGERQAKEHRTEKTTTSVGSSFHPFYEETIHARCKARILAGTPQEFVDLRICRIAAKDVIVRLCHAGDRAAASRCERSR